MDGLDGAEVGLLNVVEIGALYLLNYVASTLANDVASDVARKCTGGKVVWNCLFK